MTAHSPTKDKNHTSRIQGATIPEANSIKESLLYAGTPISNFPRIEAS
jgi:hypothetical protein